jgi:hypothetical protein
MSRAEGTFDIDRFDTQPPHDDRQGVALARAHITKTFHGDLVGNSETDIITVHTEHPAAYVGMERFEGTLHGRKGGFVLQHNAGGANGVPWMTWKIVETTGAGDLAGIRGEGQIIIGADARTPAPWTTSSDRHPACSAPGPRSCRGCTARRRRTGVAASGTRERVVFRALTATVVPVSSPTWDRDHGIAARTIVIP